MKPDTTHFARFSSGRLGAPVAPAEIRCAREGELSAQVGDDVRVLDAVRIPQPLGRPKQRPTWVTGDTGEPGSSEPTIRRWFRAPGLRAVSPKATN